MRVFFSVILILFGSFLFALTVDQFGKVGNLIMNGIGLICVAGPVYYIKARRKKK
ncbi:serine kinase [Cytobacillus gottheilii]|uniref:Serine kinase n=1 Tax=Cytobacillus gottheilii TaxID=859144 RepID=A0ABX8FHH1_9BACI|nr:serine kinase [Cytobacillus gottheilii]QVY63468.1 serine kinase [Cytobacillus gottheilii]